MDFQRAAVRFDQLASEWNSEPMPALDTLSIRRHADALQRAGKFVLAHPAAVIGNNDLGLAALAADIDEDTTAARCPVDRIVEKLGDGPAQLLRIRRNRLAGVAPQVERQSAFEDPVFLLAHDLGDKRHQFELGLAQRHQARF